MVMDSVDPKQRSRHAHPLSPPPANSPPLCPLTETSTNGPANVDSWEGILANLRSRYPGQKDSVLFCLYKLQSNPKIGLPDFRDEAALHGIPMAGRALHSAKVLMGLATAKPRAPNRPRPDVTADPVGNAPNKRTRRHRSGSDTSDESIENQVLDPVRQIQSTAAAKSDNLRHAVREAIKILQKALDE